MNFKTMIRSFFPALCLIAAAVPTAVAQRDFTARPIVATEPMPAPASIPSAARDSDKTQGSSDPVVLPTRVATEPMPEDRGQALPSVSPHAMKSSGPGQNVASGPDLVANEKILQALGKMPAAGGYSVSAKAASNLRKSVVLGSQGSLAIKPDVAKPSFCSGATYLVLLLALQELEKEGELRLEKSARERLVHKSQPDGVGVWGRWNANGPGTARLFYELNAGESFTEIANARPGDFLKIWWTDEIGAKERGHLVVFLGTRKDENGLQLLRFWSSNIPDGYGEKEVPMSKAKRVLFSRLTRPRGFEDVASLPPKDSFLAEMLTKSFTMDEVKDMTGVK